MIVALVSPKYTVLFDAVASKPLPDIVTVVPMVPLAGENDVIIGGASAIQLTVKFKLLEI